MLTKQNVHKFYLLSCAGLILFGIILGLTGRGQIHLLPGIDVGGQIYFRALLTFTYQSNLLLVFGFLVMLVANDKISHYISVSAVLATAFTGLAYNFLLIPMAGAPMFFTNYVNFSTHVLAMVLALANYLVFESKGFLRLRHVLAGLIFPGVYWAVFVTIGERIDFAPYFFMNPNDAGWLTVILWFVILLFAFAGLGFLFLWYDKNRRNVKNIM